MVSKGGSWLYPWGINTESWEMETRCLHGATGEAPQASCHTANPSLPADPPPIHFAAQRSVSPLTSVSSFHLVLCSPSQSPRPRHLHHLPLHPPLFALLQKPNKILMNPAWPLVAESAAPLTFLGRSTALQRLLTVTHARQAVEGNTVCGVSCSPPLLTAGNLEWNRDVDVDSL